MEEGGEVELENCVDPLRMKSISSKENIKARSQPQHELREEDEEVPLPPDGGWGWMVCLGSFLCNMVLDGIAYTFGVLLPPLVRHFDSDRSTISWAGSLLAGVYMLSGPLAAGLINRFGCRPVCIAGAILSWSAISLSTLSVNIPMLLITYGVVAGLGLGLVYLPATVCVGHYFESKRALATGFAVSGSGVGTFLFAPIATQLIEVYDWQTCNLIFASFFSICILSGAAMKPLEISCPDEEEADLTVQLPDGKQKQVPSRQFSLTDSQLRPIPTMPKIAEDENDLEQTQPLNTEVKKSRRVSVNPGGMGGDLHRNASAAQFRMLRPRTDLPESFSVISMSSMRKSQSQARLARPFIRKDVLFSGSLSNFQIDGGDIVVRRNSRSVLSFKEKERFLSRTSLVDYALVREEAEGEGRIATVFKSMVDISLLKDVKFLLVCLSNIAGFLGFYVPFMYLPSMAESNKNISGEQAAMILSVIGAANTIGRVATGWLSDRPWVNSLTLCSTSLILSAVCVASFPMLPSFPLFVFVSGMFGLFVAAYISSTSIILVDLVGIEKLTNSFGLITMARGTAAIIGPPIAGLIFESTQSYGASFMLAGTFFLVSGILSLAADILRRKEEKNL